MIIGGMATIPNRSDMVQRAISSILPHVDILYVWQNGMATHSSGVTAKLHYIGGRDVGDAGKFLGCQFTGARDEDILMTFDDDIIYHPSYFDHVLEDVGSGISTLHGSILNAPMVNYFKSRKNFHCRHDMAETKKVDVGGTGVMAMRFGTYRNIRPYFGNGYMADLWIALAAAKAKVPIFCLAHTSEDITVMNVGDEDTLYHKYKTRPTVQTQIAQEIIDLQ